MTIALFPGQGVQSPDMGVGLVDAVPDVFTTASEALGVDVVELCTQGQSGVADLESTRWAQPAVLVCSVAAFRVFSARGESFTAAAGHSVGEYAALVASDAVGLTEALRLISVRAQATDEAGRATPSGMAAVMRIDRETVERICAEQGIALAAENGPGQLVVSGPSANLKRAIEALGAAGAACRHLDVSAGFHSPVMASAAAPLEAALDDVEFSEPRIALWSPTTASPVRSSDEIRRALVDQLTSPVLWMRTIEGVTQSHGTALADIGPGRVVAGLTRRIVEGAEIQTLADLLVGTTERRR